MPEPAVSRHLERLTTAGLVAPAAAADEVATVPAEVRYALRVDAIHALGRRLALIERDARSVSDASHAEGTAPATAEARIIRGFLRDGRLTVIPAQEKKRLIVVRYLRDRCFTEDRPYPEQEVNQRLAMFHPDVATLRRAMVDAGLMTRDAGVYRRPRS